ncbi:hypothetical protein B0J13DRAFT_621067 [Dactylonectria estremocensis]|uniref:C2H2-type domain-containing protein n=1 Tax=Dactylonectria estremocensis TaxID=1079267 RepID=A0A9P9J8B2_9HYPO|nr:hypothetical protein B0J13DRAFT_621067 [Dactylonectria estremocensis]
MVSHLDGALWHEASSPQDVGSPSASPCGLYQSSALARYPSSGGSSQASSIPDSPLGFYTLPDTPLGFCAPPDSPLAFYTIQDSTMNDHTYQQQQNYTSAPASSSEANTPRGESSAPNRDWPVFCLSPGCNARPFRRCADLQRHYRNTHAPESQKDSYWCDYPRCTRYREPFHRRDHFRDHLREYHREDIQKRGDTVDEDWLEGRYAPSTWWRCHRCLVRVYIARNGYECPGCKTSCEPKRKEKRRSRT